MPFQNDCCIDLCFPISTIMSSQYDIPSICLSQIAPPKFSHPPYLPLCLPHMCVSLSLCPSSSRSLSASLSSLRLSPPYTKISIDSLLYADVTERHSVYLYSTLMCVMMSEIYRVYVEIVASIFVVILLVCSL